MSFYNFYDNNTGPGFSEQNNFNGYSQNDSARFNESSFNNAHYNSQNFSEDNIKSTYEKYRGYSQNELYNEFIKETAKQKANGSLNAEKLNQIKNTIMPYLSPAEQETLNKILNEIM